MGTAVGATRGQAGGIERGSIGTRGRARHILLPSASVEQQDLSDSQANLCSCHGRVVPDSPKSRVGRPWQCSRGVAEAVPGSLGEKRGGAWRMERVERCRSESGSVVRPRGVVRVFGAESVGKE